MDNTQATLDEIGYIAGLMDGEGCIAVQRSRSSARNYITTYAVNVKITNSDPNIIEAVQSIYLKLGINAYIREWKNESTKWKNWMEIYITKRSQIKVLLETILPYLRGKRARAILMLRFINKEIEREDAYQQMKALNSKGKSSETTREAPQMEGSKYYTYGSVDEDIVQTLQETV